MAEKLGWILGAAAAWLTIFSMIDSAATKKTKTLLADFFFVRSLNQDSWSKSFLSFFDLILKSPISFYRSILATSFFFLVFSFMVYSFSSIKSTELIHICYIVIVGSFISLIAYKAIGFRALYASGVGYNSIKQLLLALISIPAGILATLPLVVVEKTIKIPIHQIVGGTAGVLFPFIINLVADFISLNQTRYFITLHIARKWNTPLLILSDLIISVLIYLATGLFILISSLYVSNQPDPLFLTILEFIRLFAVAENSNQILSISLLISFFTTIIASAWLWVFLSGRYLLSTLIKTHKVFQRLSTRFEKRNSITVFGIFTLPFVIVLIVIVEILLP